MNNYEFEDGEARMITSPFYRNEYQYYTDQNNKYFDFRSDKYFYIISNSQEKAIENWMKVINGVREDKFFAAQTTTLCGKMGVVKGDNKWVISIYFKDANKYEIKNNIEQLGCKANENSYLNEGR